MPFLLLLEGVSVGFVVAMPIGPIGILCIRRTLTLGRKQGFTTGLAGSAADILYVIAALFSIRLIADAVSNAQQWMRFSGGIAVLAIGIVTFRSRPGARLRGSTAYEHTRLFVSTFFLALSNPTPLFGYAAMFTALGFRLSGTSATGLALVVAGVFLGCMLWFSMLTAIAHAVRRKMTDKSVARINTVAGVILIVLGLVAVLSSLHGIWRP